MRGVVVRWKDPAGIAVSGQHHDRAAVGALEHVAREHDAWRPERHLAAVQAQHAVPPTGLLHQLAPASHGWPHHQHEGVHTDMANFSASDVKKLRDTTGAGMMDCKKALDEAEGDFDAAVDILRTKGAAKAAKRGAEREATAGLVATSGGALVELNSETDFVAKNDEFIAVAQKIADAATAAKAADTESLKAVQLGDKTVGEVVEQLAITIGEKIELGRVAYFDGPVVTYMHRRASDLPPAVGVLVAYDGTSDEAARGAAMQIAAMKPQYLTREDVPAEIVAKEREIAEATSREEGKPEQAIAKITEGRLNGFFKDVVLLDQPSVTDSKKSVKAVLDEAGVSVTRFARFEIGQ